MSTLTKNKHALKESVYRLQDDFVTETGQVLKGVEIAYTTLGEYHKGKSQVVWIYHAFTANSNPTEWWPGMVGDGTFFNPDNFFIICANILGSCYGTTGPLSVNPETGKPWYRSFPEITVRDQVRLHELLRQALGIEKLRCVVGASIGGHQAIEYCVMYPERVEKAIFIATNAANTPWAIAFSESQRLSIDADPTFSEDYPQGGLAGLKAARSIALLSYRNRYTYNQTQQESSNDKIGGYKASSYQAYQGDKLVKRFNAYSYYRLTQALDSHNVARNRGSIAEALGQITAEALVVGISSDALFPPEDQLLIHNNLKRSTYHEIDSFYGHDGFLLEDEQLTKMFTEFLKN